MKSKLVLVAVLLISADHVFAADVIQPIAFSRNKVNIMTNVNVGNKVNIMTNVDVGNTVIMTNVKVSYQIDHASKIVANYNPHDSIFNIGINIRF